MLKFSAVSQIWKKYSQKLNDWDLPLRFESLKFNLRSVKKMYVENIHEFWIPSTIIFENHKIYFFS